MSAALRILSQDDVSTDEHTYPQRIHMDDAPCELESARLEARALCRQIERQAEQLAKLGNQVAHLRRRCRELQCAREQLAGMVGRLAAERDAWRTIALLQRRGDP